jgi:hypothetical protein
MYTKIGLGLLAAAGLTFGVVGMQTGGASPATPVCTHDGGGSASGDANASVSGDQNGAANQPANGNAGAEGNGSGLANGNGNGNANPTDNGNGSGNGNGSPTPTTANPGSNHGSASAADTTFLDLSGHTDRTGVADGTATVPQTDSQLTGHSRFLHRLLRIDGDVNTDR